MESGSCGKGAGFARGNEFTSVEEPLFFTSVEEPLFFALLPHASVWLLFNRLLAFLFSLFTSSESLTGSYTEDEPRKRVGYTRIVMHYFIPLSCSTDSCAHFSNRHNLLPRTFSSSSFEKAPGPKVGISKQRNLLSNCHVIYTLPLKL